jgi:ERCC4-type nuclease
MHDAPDIVHRVVVDHSEGRSALLEAIRRCGRFEVEMARLSTGDYLIDDNELIERKSAGDLLVSLVDGRLFLQVAGLADSRHRSLLLIEGPPPASAPNVHPSRACAWLTHLPSRRFRASVPSRQPAFEN